MWVNREGRRLSRARSCKNGPEFDFRRFMPNLCDIMIVRGARFIFAQGRKDYTGAEHFALPVSVMFSRLIEWGRSQVPTRERLERNRFVAPLAAKPELWRFTRRTVPRGVAIGLFVGIFLMVPGLQVVGAALLCLPFRANIPIAAITTFVSLPPTVLFVFLPAAAEIGNRFGYHADLATVTGFIARGATPAEWLAWGESDAAPAIGLGLILLALAAAVLGHVIASRVWRWRVMRRRQLRQGQLRRPGRLALGDSRDATLVGAGQVDA